MIDYSQILTINYPGSVWSICEDYSTLEWFSETPKPTQEELDGLWEQTKSILATNIAKENRRIAYIKESDPIFFKAQRGEATIDQWKEKVAEINARFPY